jgi:hypothetical protein
MSNQGSPHVLLPTRILLLLLQLCASKTLAHSQRSQSPLLLLCLHAANGSSSSPIAPLHPAQR